VQKSINVLVHPSGFLFFHRQSRVTVIAPSWCLDDPEAEFGRENLYPDSGLCFPQDLQIHHNCFHTPPFRDLFTLLISYRSQLLSHAIS